MIIRLNCEGAQDLALLMTLTESVNIMAIDLQTVTKDHKAVRTWLPILSSLNKKDQMLYAKQKEKSNPCTKLKPCTKLPMPLQAQTKI